MAVTTPCYCTREDVKRSTDMRETARNNWQIDRAIQSAARNIEGHMHRRFYPEDATRKWDFPSFQYAYPWRLWLDAWELAAIPTLVTSGGTTIPLSACNFEPANSGPPYTYLELRRDMNYAFGVGSTPQRDIAITGTFGYWTATDPAGTLAAAIGSTTATTATISDGSLVGVGDLLIVDSERMLVSGRSTVDTGQTNTAGGTTASQADVAITVPDATQVHLDEVIQMDSERMLIADITGNVLTVKRAWDGTNLATHSTGTHIYAFRTLTVARGQLGTTAATHLIAAPASISRVPTLIRDLAIAEATNRVLAETGGYSDPQGEGGGAIHGRGSALADLWDEAETAYGRKNRKRVI
jgi:hypothetical protein